MNRSAFLKQSAAFVGGSLIWLPRVNGQAERRHEHYHHHYILPHTRPPLPSPAPQAGTVEVRAIAARAEIDGQRASTELVIEMVNPSSAQQEGEALIPVPHGAALKSFALEGTAGSFQAELLPRSEARRIYDEIVRRSKDPAILEFAGFGTVRTGVFPVPARSSVRLRIVYEELLPAEDGRIDYVLPRSESLDYEVAWTIDVDWRLGGGIAALYSPSHEIRVRRNDGRAEVRMAGRLSPGPLRLSALPRSKGKASAAFIAHPEPEGGAGYFLLLMTPPAIARPKLKREVTLVLDRSGSMAGEKLDQARAAALQVIEGLEDGEHFNVIVYNEAVDRFAETPVEVTRDNVLEARDFIGGIRVSGGTNIFGALSEAVSQPATRNAVPIVLFLTDGLPTIGETSEKRIRAEISAANGARRRIFTFGVGVDVNTPLLSRLADDSRATATFVLPEEDVEVKVASVFRRLSGPVLSYPELQAIEEDGEPARGRVDDVIPHDLPDFFEGDQIVVTGRYRGERTLRFRLSGGDGDGERIETFAFKPGRKPHPFAARLWATRKIAVLTDALRDLGADSALRGLSGDAIDPADPRVRELVDEIVRLSTEFGILTEHTAFLAREGEVFAASSARSSQAGRRFGVPALQERTGNAGVSQELNLWQQKNASNLNPSNQFLNSRFEQESIADVYQCGDKAFFKRGREWVDAAAIVSAAGTDLPPAEEVEVGSERFGRLVDRLVANEQQGCLVLGTGTEVVVDGTRYRIR